MTCSPYQQTGVSRGNSGVPSPFSTATKHSAIRAPHFTIICAGVAQESAPEFRLATALQRRLDSLGCVVNCLVFPDPSETTLPQNSAGVVVIAPESVADDVCAAVSGTPGFSGNGRPFATIVPGTSPSAAAKRQKIRETLLTLGLLCAEEEGTNSLFEDWDLTEAADDHVFHGAGFMQEISNTAAILMLAASEYSSPSPLAENHSNQLLK